MTKRNSLLYSATFFELQKLCLKLNANLKHVMLDFEKAVVKSLKETFSNTEIHICWFHTKKVNIIISIYKKLYFVFILFHRDEMYRKKGSEETNGGWNTSVPECL